MRQREMLLIHFSTKMSKHRHVMFPNDLRYAKDLRGRHLSFSTFGAADRGIREVEDESCSHAAGYVGLIVDILDVGSIHKVSHEDVGSYEDPEGVPHSAGDPPSPEACAKSVDKRVGTNEWYVKDFAAKGIFLIDPDEIEVRQVEDPPEGLDEETLHLWNPTSENAAFRPYDAGQVIADFPDDRIFSRREGGFIEWDRKTKTWLSVSYDDIITP